MTQYTDYTFYKEQYGGELTEGQFRRVIVPVSAHIRRITFDRADRSMEEVQHAACACCDLLYADQAAKAEHQGGRIRKHRRLFCFVCTVTGRQNRPGDTGGQDLPDGGVVLGTDRPVGYGGV